MASSFRPPPAISPRKRQSLATLRQSSSPPPSASSSASTKSGPAPSTAGLLATIVEWRTADAVLAQPSPTQRRGRHDLLDSQSSRRLGLHGPSPHHQRNQPLPPTNPPSTPSPPPSKPPSSPASTRPAPTPSSPGTSPATTSPPGSASPTPPCTSIASKGVFEAAAFARLAAPFFSFRGAAEESAVRAGPTPHHGPNQPHTPAAQTPANVPPPPPPAPAAAPSPLASSSMQRVVWHLHSEIPLPADPHSAPETSSTSAVNGHDPSPTLFFGSYRQCPQKFDMRLIYAAPET